MIGEMFKSIAKINDWNALVLYTKLMEALGATAPDHSRSKFASTLLPLPKPPGSGPNRNGCGRLVVESLNCERKLRMSVVEISDCPTTTILWPVPLIPAV